MFKTIAEPFWLERETRETSSVSAVSVKGWLSKAIRALSHFDLPTKDNNGSQETFIAWREGKARAARQHIKDDFFCQRACVGHKRISEKTWKRHSAFLVYREEARRQQGYGQQTGKQQLQDRPTAGNINFNSDTPKAAVVDCEPARLTSNGSVKAGKSVRVKVTSLRYLPVWATSLHDVSLIKIDINTPHLLNAGKPAGKLAAAA